MSQVAGTLKSWAVRDVVTDRRVRTALGMLAFVLATTFGAYVAVPLPGTHVPVTLQGLFVIMSGVLLGPLAGAGAMAIYVAMGAAGAPVFALGGAGLPWLMGPTGGYLVAMPAAAYVAGVIAGRDRRAPRLVAGLVLASMTIYVGGVAQLGFLTGQGLGDLLAVGVLPFLVGDVTKIVVALLLIRSVKSLGR